MSDDTPNQQRSPFSEETVVHPADAKTVIRPSATHFEAMPEVSHSMKDESTEGAIVLPSARTRSRSRSRSKGPDLKLIIGGAVTLALVAGVFFQLSKGSSKAVPAVTATEQVDLASVSDPAPVVQKFKSADTAKSTDVLAKFEQASARAQQRAFEPAK